MNMMVDDAVQSSPLRDGGSMTRPRGIGQSCRVLVAEDNPMQREVVGEILLAMECQVQLASNGAEALDWYRMERGCYDLVLTDLEMPEMNGVELAQAVRRLCPMQPIVVMSANFRKQIQKQIPSGLMVEILEKPFRISDLLRIIDGVVNAKCR